MELLLILALIAAAVLWLRKRAAEQAAAKNAKLAAELKRARAAAENALETERAVTAHLSADIARLQSRVEELDTRNTTLEVEIATLSQFRQITDAQAEARRILDEAAQLRKDIAQATRTKQEQADAKLAAAGDEAARIIEAAKRRAEDIAGQAYALKNRADEFADAAAAMQNVIKGYGDQYIIPTYSLLDELADEFGHTEAGAALKKAREATRALIKAGRAAICDYVDEFRRQNAINFVIDAFNGKVDSILARGKSDNHGKLAQEIRDAFALVNHNGRAFRDAKITPEYLDARLAELKWASVARALKEQEREEQRQLREQMREEEKARREYERAMRDAAKEEELIRKAMEKVQHQVATASEAQRAAYETKLAELQDRLQAAEEKNQRALSMAQQTRTGHVYVISNVGSFGEEVFKIGMTRRLEPKDRVRELGDASVPFEFDIHAMLYSEDAPGLERTLHRHFLRRQMNKVNPRKEFFRVSLADIRTEVEAMGLAAHWTMTAEAHDYRETLRIEQQMRENPAIERDWTEHQLEYEPVMERDEEEAAA